MNEKQLFELAVKNGYTKGINEFRALMSSNKKAVDDMFKIAKANGYTKKINDFTTFVGFGGKKKKVVTTTTRKVVTTTTVSPSEQRNINTTSDTEVQYQAPPLGSSDIISNQEETPDFSSELLKKKPKLNVKLDAPPRPTDESMNPITKKPYNINNMMEAASLKAAQKEWDKKYSFPLAEKKEDKVTVKQEEYDQINLDKQDALSNIEKDTDAYKVTEKMFDDELIKKAQELNQEADKVLTEPTEEQVEEERPYIEFSYNDITNQLKEGKIPVPEWAKEATLRSFDKKLNFDYTLLGEGEKYISNFLNENPELNKDFQFEETGSGDIVKVTSIHSGRLYTFAVDQDDEKLARRDFERLKFFLNRNTKEKLKDEMEALNTIRQSTRGNRPQTRLEKIIDNNKVFNLNPIITNSMDNTNVALEMTGQPLRMPEYMLDLNEALELDKAEETLLTKRIGEIESIDKRKKDLENKRKNLSLDNYSVQEYQNDLQNLDNEYRATIGTDIEGQAEVQRILAKTLNKNEQELNRLNDESKKIEEEEKSILLRIEENNGVITPEIESDIIKLGANTEYLKYGLSNLTMNNEELNKTRDVINRSIADIALIKESEGSKSGIILNNFMRGASTFARTILNDKQMADKLVEVMGDPTTTMEYESSDERSTFDTLLATFSNMGGIIIPSMLTGPAAPYIQRLGFMAQAKFQLEDEMANIEGFDKIDPGIKEGLSYLYGGVVGLLESYGVSKMFGTSTVGKKFTIGILSNVLRSIPKGTTPEALKAAVESTVKRMAANGLLQGLGGLSTEGITEGSQTFFEKALKFTVNEIAEKDLFDEDFSAEAVFNDVWESTKLGFMAGGISQAVVQSTNIVKTGFKNKEFDNQIAITLRNIGNDKTFRSTMTNYFKTRILQGEITREEALQAINSYDVMMGRMNEIPSDIKNVTTTFDLLTEKARIENEIEGKNPSLVVKQKERLNEINKELEAQTDDTVVEQPEMIEETEEAPITEEVTTTEKQPGEKDNIAGVDIVYPTNEQSEQRKEERTKPEYVDEAAKKNEQEDVDKLKGELDGEFGILTGENPLGQPLTEEENSQLNEKAEAWLKERGYNPRKVTGKYGQAENSFFVPNLTKEDAIAFAKEFNQESVAHSEGLVYQDGSMNPRVKTEDNFEMNEYTPESDFVSVVNTPEGLKTFSVGYDFDTKTDPTIQEEVTPTEEVTTTEEVDERNNVDKIVGALEQDTKTEEGEKETIYDRASLDEIFVEGRRINATNEEINEAARKLGYSQDKIRKYREKAEKIYNPKTGSIRVDNVLKSINTFRKKMFSAKRMLPVSVFRALEDRDAKIASDLQAVEKNTKDYNNFIKSREFKKKYKTKEERQKIVQDFDAYIRGDKSVVLPEELKTIGLSMRLHIDGLSLRLINSGLISESLSLEQIKDGKSYQQYIKSKAFKNKSKKEQNKILKDFENFVNGTTQERKNITLPAELAEVARASDLKGSMRDNLGSYLTRSYKTYDRKSWKNEVADEVIQKAKNVIRGNFMDVETGEFNDSTIQLAEEFKVTPEEYVESMVDKKIDEYISKFEKPRIFAKKAKKGSKDLDVLKKINKDIPIEIQQLMGVYQDPGINYAKTIMKISALSNNHQYLSSIKEKGMGVFFFNEKDPNRPKGSRAIASKGSETMYPLNGVYTSPEIADEFEKMPTRLDGFMNFVTKGTSVVKWAKTIGSISTHIKNVIGNLGFVWINGHYDLTEMSTAYKTVMNDLRSKNKGDLREKMREYIELGIVKQSAGLNEIRDMFKDANYETALYSRLSDKKLGLFNKSKKFIFKGKQFVEDMYQAEDDFFKIVAYENELSSYSKAMFGKPKNELTAKELTEVNKVVGEIVKNTYPTYSRVPEFIKKIRRNPLIGNFVSFQAESYRTAYNTVNLARKELKSDNPSIRKIGARRLVGATTYIAAKDTVLTYSSMAAGQGLVGILGYFDDDEEKEKGNAYRKFVTEWAKDSDLFILPAKEGEFRYIDFSASDPHGGINKVINAAMSGENFGDSFAKTISAFIEPFTGIEISTQAGINLAANRDAYGRKIYKTTDSFDEQMLSILEFVYNVVEPGTVTTVRRIVGSDEPLRDLIPTLTGFRPYKGKFSDQFGYFIGKKKYNELPEISEDIDDVVQKWKDDEANDEELVDSYKKWDDKHKELYNEIIDMYQAAMVLGADEEELVNQLKKKRFSKKMIESIRMGEVLDASLPEDEEAIQDIIKGNIKTNEE